MKKNYLLTAIFVIFSTFVGNAQLFTEDFSAGVPANGWTIDGHADNWEQRSTSNAGGTAPEARFSWTPQFNGTTRLVSPAIDLTGTSSVFISFKHTIDHYGGPYTVGVATRSNNGTWNTVWSMTGDVLDKENRLVLVNNSDTNQADFQFCFFFTGDSYNINYWYIDDVEVTIAQQLDLKVSSINNLPFVEQSIVDISSTVTNLGLDAITSFDITYTDNGANPVTESVTGVNITSSNSYDYTFNTQWNATAGSHDIEVTISNVNGVGNDNDTSNDSTTKTISVATQTTTNFPLFEEFTSSTCGPCAGFNSSSMSPFMNSHPDDIAVIKYQMNWPGNGDPYFTAEGATRRFYYGVNAVPDLYIGGQAYPTTSAGLNAGFNAETSRSAFFDIQADFSVNGNVITINETITPYLTGNFKLHTVVVEKVTTGNVGSNGETEFHNVMMKMLPDANGQDVNFVANQAYTNNFTYDMSSTFVEEMSDLAVVIFVQYDDTKMLMQSKYVPTSANSINNEVFENISVYPNPSNGILHINTNEEISVSVIDLVGKTVISNQLISDNSILDLTSLNNGVYFVKVTIGTKTGVKKIVLNK